MMKNSSLSPAIERILDAARWAPSGDNAQPWSFEIEDDRNLTLRVRCEPGNVYEYRNGEPTLISAGTLLENIALAAPSFGKRMAWTYQGQDGGVHRIHVHFEDLPSAAPHPLMAQIYQRSVDRRPYRMLALPPDAKRLLSDAVGPDISVEWYESLGARRRVAALTRAATDIRLRIPETFAIHGRIVDWDRALSPDGIPSKALGVDAMTQKMMRWSLADKKRTDMANRFGSPFFAGLQMDFLPGIFSAAYFAFRLPDRSPNPEEAVTRLLRVGQAVQRFWLTATKLGLALQPCLATLAFAHYGSAGEAFTVSEPERGAAARLAVNAGRVLTRPQELVFLGRIGLPKPRQQESRSTRVGLNSLIWGSAA